MKKIDKEEQKKPEEKQEHTKTKITICIIIIIIIILLLLTSCTSNFWGKIGNIFTGETDVTITDKPGDKDIITNKDLIFKTLKSSISLDDDVYKINFDKNTLGTNDFTCVTSDAKIATCIAKKDYVEVYPKKAGNVIIYVKADTNGKTYQGTHNLTITESKRRIVLSKTKGSIYLSDNDTINVPYYLRNISGSKVNVEVSDKDVASASVNNGILKITAKKAGKANITLTVEYKGKTYQATYRLTAYKERPVTTTPTKKTTTTKSTGSSSTKKTNSTTKKTTTKSTSTSTTKKPTTSTTTTKKTTTSTTTTTKKPTTSTTTPTTVAKSNENRLNNIEVVGISLDKNFNSNNEEYVANVSADTNSVKINIEKKHNKQTIEYYIDGVKVSSLNNKTSIDVALNNLLTKVEIKVTAEDGVSTKTYVVNVNKDKSTNNNLSSLSTTVGSLTPSFDKNETNYQVRVNYDTNNIGVNYNLEDSRSSVTFKVDNVAVTKEQIKNIALTNKETKVEVIVKSESGKDKTYTITVTKPIRKIEFESNTFEEFIENTPFKIAYTVYEDDVEIHDYNTRDISLTINNFKGTYKVDKDYIEVTPANEDVNKTFNASISYCNTSSNITIKVKMKDYFLKVLSNTYDVDIIDGKGEKNIIFNTNLLGDNIKTSNITNGVMLSSNHSVIKAISENTNIAKVSFIKDDNNDATSYYSLHVDALNEGTVDIVINSNVYGVDIPEVRVTLKIVKKYKFVIDAQDGFFDAFSSKYEYTYESGKEINLAEYEAMKEATGNCMYFVLDSYNTKTDGTGVSYQSDQVFNLTSDLTLYAIYKNTAEEVKITEPGKLYLSDVDIFENKEYFEKYNVKNMIYPGSEVSEGSFKITINNNSSSKLKITKINLEEDTICISERRCINMGYIIKYTNRNMNNYTFPYGGVNNYQVLNTDSQTITSAGALTGYHTERNIDLGIEIDKPNANNEFANVQEIYLLWKWVEVDDDLDTKIGSSINESNNKYHLTISFDYEKQNNHCVIN